MALLQCVINFQRKRVCTRHVREAERERKKEKIYITFVFTTVVKSVVKSAKWKSRYIIYANENLNAKIKNEYSSSSMKGVEGEERKKNEEEEEEAFAH